MPGADEPPVTPPPYGSIYLLACEPLPFLMVDWKP